MNAKTTLGILLFVDIYKYYLAYRLLTEEKRRIGTEAINGHTVEASAAGAFATRDDRRRD